MVRFSLRKRGADTGRNRPEWGNLRSLEPFSDQWGFDRGTPIDRYYIDAFINTFAEDIRGHVLEVKEPWYAGRVGDASAMTVHIVDVNPANEKATLIADLGKPGSLP